MLLKKLLQTDNMKKKKSIGKKYSKMFIVFLILISLFNSNIKADENPKGIFLITCFDEWKLAGFNNSNLPVWNEQGLLEFWKPIALKKEDIHNLKISDVEHTIYNGNNAFYNRFRSIDFKILESETYYVVLYHMLTYASNESFNVDIKIKIKGEELPYSWWNSSWNNYVLIDIDNSQVETTSIEDYVVLVEIPTAYGLKMDNSNSLRFVELDNSTPIEGFDVDHWDENSNSYVWVKINNFQPSTQFLCYYNNSLATSTEDAYTCWNNSFLAVHHFEESDTPLDSTSNNNNLVNDGSDYETSLIGNSYELELDNTDKMIYNDNMDGLSAITIEGWYKQESFNSPVNTIINSGYDTNNFNEIIWGVWMSAIDTINFKVSSDSGYICNYGYDTDIAGGNWVYFLASWDGTQSELIVNGQLVAYDRTASGTMTTHASAECVIGAEKDAASYRFYTDQDIEEIRVSNIGKSTGYAYTSYNNMNNKSSFATLIGEITKPEETILALPTASNFNPSNNSNNIAINNNFSCYINQANGTSIIYTIECTNGYNNSGTGLNETIYINFSNCNFYGWNYTVWTNLTCDETNYSRYITNFRTTITNAIIISEDTIKLGIVLLLLSFAIMLTLSNRYLMIILGMILGLTLTGLLYNDMSYFNFDIFPQISGSFFLAAGIINFAEKLFKKKNKK